jgi:hypothetical protein
VDDTNFWASPPTPRRPRREPEAIVAEADADDGVRQGAAGEPSARTRCVTAAPDYYSAALGITDADEGEVEALPEATADAVEPAARPQARAVAAAIGSPVRPQRVEADRADHG